MSTAVKVVGIVVALGWLVVAGYLIVNRHELVEQIFRQVAL